MKLNRILFGVLISCVLAGSSYGMTFIYKYYAQTKKIAVIKKPATNDKARNKQAVISIIKTNLQQIEDCYNQRLQEGQLQEGALKIGWYLDGSGQSKDIEEMINELDDPEMYECSALAIQEWEFPKNVVIQIHYTFHLRQKRQPSSKNFENPSNNEY